MVTAHHGTGQCRHQLVQLIVDVNVIVGVCVCACSGAARMRRPLLLLLLLRRCQFIFDAANITNIIFRLRLLRRLLNRLAEVALRR